MINKILDNLGFRSLNVMGLTVTFRSWIGFLFNLPQILKKRNLVPLDRFMSIKGNLKIKGRFGTFTVNPHRIDTLIKEESMAYSAIREIYIRDCYLRFYEIPREEIKTIVDLGANRGMVSAMFTPVAEKIILIEAQEKYNSTIKEILETMNGFKDYRIGNYFLGRNEYILRSDNKINFQFILENYQLDTIDFLKIDIEGSEFDIFEELPFNRIKYIAMEVHRDYGDPASLVNILTTNKFKYYLSDSNFNKTDNLSNVDYIYAWNPQLRK